MKIALHLSQTRPDGNRCVVFTAQLLACWFMMNKIQECKENWTWNHSSFPCISKRSKAALSLRKSILAARQRNCDFLNGSRTEGQKSDGRACLWCPWERKCRTENTEQTARLLLRKPGHPASPGQGPRDTFPPAALRKQTRHCAESSSVCAPGEYGGAPSTGCLLLNVRNHFVWTSLNHIPKARVLWSFNNSMYVQSERQNGCAGWEKHHWGKSRVLNLNAFFLLATETHPRHKRKSLKRPAGNVLSTYFFDLNDIFSQIFDGLWRQSSCTAACG